MGQSEGVNKPPEGEAPAAEQARPPEPTAHEKPDAEPTRERPADVPTDRPLAGEGPRTEKEALAKAEQPPEESKGAQLPGGAAPQRPARPARAEREAKVAVKEPAPPGSIADDFKEALPGVSMEAYQGFTNVIVEVGRDDIPKVMRAAKEDPRLDLKFLRVLFGVDHQDEGMEVVYELLSLEKNHTVTVKTRVPHDDARVASVADVWNAANWHERETRDMFGIAFDGHPHLVPLLLPEDMTDHFPLRKDNPLAEIEEWQGELLGDGAAGDDEEAEE